MRMSPNMVGFAFTISGKTLVFVLLLAMVALQEEMLMSAMPHTLLVSLYVQITCTS